MVNLIPPEAGRNGKRRIIQSPGRVLAERVGSMINGTGIDMVSIPRISGLIDRYGERFLRKVFTEAEIEEGLRRRDAAQYFAARFAAREAFFKALGTGWGRGISLREVAVVRDGSGRPGLEFSERLGSVLEERGVVRSHLSLSHDAGMAQALVILEGGEI